MDLSKRYDKFKSYYSKDFKSFIRSIVALLMTVMLVLGSTFAWIEGGKDAKAEDGECTISAGAGLQFVSVNDGEINNGVLTLPGKLSLEDCSSVDGRNIFFPTTGSIRPSNATTSTTDNLRFRSAVESDKNKKYVTQDFIVTSLESKNEDGTGGTTPIYIDASSVFEFGKTGGKAIRLSLNFNDGSAPVVFCPALAITDNESRSVDAVASINSDGTKYTTQLSSAYKLNKFAYGKTPVYNLPYGESRRVTVTMWLEGTDDDCTVDKVASASINMSLILSTEDLNMRTVTFVDNSPQGWVGNDNASVCVVDSNNTNVYTKMAKSGNTYTARISSSITKVKFCRLAASETEPDVSVAHNTWDASDMTFDSNSNTEATYYAIGRGVGPDPKNPVDPKNYGYWVTPDCTGIVTVKFTDNKFTGGGWPYIYIYDTGNYSFSVAGSDGMKRLFGRTWPGFQMEKTGDKTFTFKFPAVKGINFIINDGTDNSNLVGTETPAITNQNNNYEFSYTRN